MPRKPARNVPGTERYRDERRADPKPKMHGRQWHDHAQPKDFEPAAMAGADAIPEVEGGGRKVGTGRLRGGKVQGTQGRVRRKRTTPVGKGPKNKPDAAKKISQSGMRGRGRA